MNVNTQERKPYMSDMQRAVNGFACLFVDRIRAHGVQCGVHRRLQRICDKPAADQQKFPRILLAMALGLSLSCIAS